MKSVSIVIVNWNAGKLLQECVESVLEYAEALVAQIIIIDNASSDNSIDLLPSSTLITIIQNKTNRGFGAACNQGYLASIADYVLLLNPDARLLQGSLQKSVDFMEANKKFAVLGVKHIDESNQVQPSCSRYPSFGGFITLSLGLDKIAPNFFKSPILMLDYDYEKPGEVDQVMGAFMFIRRSVIGKLNTFMDEQFFVYYDDLDFSKRVSLSGEVSFYNPDITIYHKGNGTTDSIKDLRIFYSLQSRLRYIKKYFGALQVVILSFVSLCIEPVARITQLILKRRSAEIREVLKGYYLLYRSLLRNG